MHRGYPVNKAVAVSERLTRWGFSHDSDGKYRHIFYFSHNLFIVFVSYHFRCVQTPTLRRWGENRLQQSFQTHSLSEVTLLLRYSVGQTPANRDISLLPLRPSFPITMATPSHQHSKPCSRRKVLKLCAFVLPPALPSLSIILCSSFYHPFSASISS